MLSASLRHLKVKEHSLLFFMMLLFGLRGRWHCTNFGAKRQATGSVCCRQKCVMDGLAAGSWCRGMEHRHSYIRLPASRD